MSYLALLGGYLLFIIMVAAPVAAFVYLENKWRLRKFLKSDNTVSSGAPLHIHLNEEIEPDWVNKKPIKAFIAELEKLGYQRGKSYSIFGRDDFSLLVFYKAPLVAVLYTHNAAGNWVEIGADEIDGNEYAFINAPRVGQFETRPEAINEYLPQASIAEIHTKAERLVNSIGNDFVDINADNFRECFESASKKSRAFTVRKGGVSIEEFVAVANELPFNNKFAEFVYTANELPFNSKDEQIKEGFTEYKKHELDQWHEAALEEYRVSENIDKDKFYDIGPKLFIIPFKSHSPAVVQYLAGQGFITDKQEEQLMKVAEKVDDVNILFDRINEMLSPDLRPDFVKDIDYPLPIRLFKKSQKMTDRY